MNTVKYHVVKVVHSAPGHFQKREISSRSAACYYQRNHKLKFVEGVSCVTQLSCVKPYYLPPADRPGTGDYKMPCVRVGVRASVRHIFTKAFLSLKIL